jgi:hypothetical protein
VRSGNDATTSWLMLIFTSPCHKSIFNVYKVFEALVCCHKGIWLHPYTITPAKLPPDDHFTHPC